MNQGLKSKIQWKRWQAMAFRQREWNGQRHRGQRERSVFRRAGRKVESTVGVGGLGARAGAAGGGPTTRGLGFKARELAVIPGTVAASRLFEWQGGAPVREPCPREVTRRGGGGLLGGLGKVLPVGSSSVSSSVRWTQQGGPRPLRACALGRGLAEGQLGKRQSRGAVSDRPSRPCRHL